MTGYARKYSDAVAEFYNLAQEWRRVTLQGCGPLLEIAKSLQHHVSQCELEDRYVFPYPLQIGTELQKLFVDLSYILEDLRRISTRMCVLSDHLRILLPHKDSVGVPFLSWSAEEFANAFEKLSTLYQRELAIKDAVVKEVAYQPSTAMWHVVVWTHEPVLGLCSNRAAAMLREMVLETMHDSC